MSSSKSQKLGFDISSLTRDTLIGFFDQHDKVKDQKISKSKDLIIFNNFAIPQPTDFIHFIWMGNPIKEKGKKTILSWMKRYPSKQIILWVDEKSLKDTALINFAKDNDIKLIDIEEVFSEEYCFGLGKIIQLEKDRLPPNWGAVSDIYRYLIMYYFGGTYSDMDCPIDFFRNS